MLIVILINDRDDDGDDYDDKDDDAHPWWREGPLVSAGCLRL